MTYEEQFNSAMKCQTMEEADAWMAKKVQRYEDMTTFAIFSAGVFFGIVIGAYVGLVWIGLYKKMRRTTVPSDKAQEKL